MTIFEKIQLLDNRQVSCPLIGKFEGVKPSNYYFGSSSGSFQQLLEKVQQGDKNFVTEYLPFYQYKMKWVKYAFKLFNSYKGEKGLDRKVDLIKVWEGKIYFNEEIYENYMKFHRLVDHALIRCMKHPLNKQ